MSVAPFEQPQPPVTGDRRTAGWNATGQPYPTDRLVPALVAAHARTAPSRPAVVAPDGALSYADLDERAGRLAARLRRLGVGPGVPVGLCLPRSAALAVGALGVLRAGGAYVPLDPGYPPDRLRFMLQDSGAPVVVTDAAGSALLPPGPWAALALDDAGAGPAADAGAAAEPGPDDLAYVIYTSGSTGRPKGVEVTHRNLLNLVFWHRRAFDVTAEDRATQLASPSFDAAVWETWPYLAAGASLRVPDEATRVSPAALRDWLVAEGVTITFLPTPLAEAVLALDWPAGARLRTLLTGGDALHRHPAPGLPFTLVNNYGPTEGTVVATSGAVAPAAGETGAPTIGRPIANTRLHVLDAELRLVPAGEAGELCIAGDGLASGYRGRPDLTAERFVQVALPDGTVERLYRTGDLARWRDDGEVEFLGRLDEQVKIRGHRVELHEVAAALDAHPAVGACAVVARDAGDGDRRLVAYLTPAPGHELDRDALRAHLSDRLPAYMLPAAYVPLGELPVTPNGKVDRDALPEPDAENTGRPRDGSAPRTLVEQALAGIVCELLRLDQVSVDENFFVLGGHSLLGAQLIARVRDRFGVEMDLRTLFDNPAVAPMAAIVEARLLEQLEALSEEEAERRLAEGQDA
jgi:amino acid adenylation domain-containing protein